MQYADMLKPQCQNITLQKPKVANMPIPIKPVTLLHDEPYIRWTEAEVKK